MPLKKQHKINHYAFRKIRTFAICCHSVYYLLHNLRIIKLILCNIKSPIR